MKNVKDIYPVSPMQEIMLLHALSRKQADKLFNQFCFRIDSDLDPHAFRASWNRIAERHDALRTAFIWEGLKQPQQVVRARVELPFTELDWRHFGEIEREREFAALLAADREEGFDLRRAPLMRFSLVRTGERSWYFVWSSHHLIIDRWCIGQIFAELDRFYPQLAAQQNVVDESPPPSFSTYIRWIARQDRNSTLAYWQAALRGLDRPTLLTDTVADGTVPAGQASHVSRHLTDDLQAGVDRTARLCSVTRSVIVQGAWALTINRIVQTQDAVFGAAVSGRPTDISQVESIVGSFINNVPVRVALPSDATVESWLTGIQAAQFDRAPHEYSSPGDIRRLCHFNESSPLFDSLVVWLSGQEGPRSIPMQPLMTSFATAFPLTFSVSDDADGMTLRLDCNGSCKLEPAMLLREVESSLHTLLAADRSARLADLPGFFEDVEFVAVDAEHCDEEASLASVDAIADEVARGRERLRPDLLQEILREEWSIVLGNSNFNNENDFFQLGGTSLQAAQLHTRIESATRQSLPMLALFERATVCGMAATLHAGDWPLLSGACLGLRTSGTGTPLHCIASPEVNTVGYSILTRHLPDQQRVYLVQEPPQSGRLQQLDPNSLPDIAERYTKSVRKIQPRGPYRLLGMCDGAYIAFEMARRLEAEGQTVEFLGIVNTWGLYTVSRLYYLNRLLNIVDYYVDALRDRWRSALPERLTGADPEPSGQYAGVTGDLLPPMVDSGAGNPWIEQVGFASRDPHKPRIRSEVTVFRIGPQPFWRTRDRDLGWSRHAGNVDIVHLDCDDHDEIMRRQNIRQLAEGIGQKFKRCDSAATDKPGRQRRRCEATMDGTDTGGIGRPYPGAARDRPCPGPE